MKKIRLWKAIIVTLMVMASVIALGFFMLKKIYPKSYSEYVEKYSKKYNVDEKLIYAVIKEESNFNKDISSKRNAIGLMQLVQSTADEIGNDIGIENINLKNPEVNIQIGTKYLSNLLKKYDGNVEIAIVAYNAGIGNVDKWIKENRINKNGSNLEKVPFKETNMYLRKVMRTYKLYKRMYRT